ncbi:MAG: FliG C-terminal domain-containing protein [Balneolaceae bacterium]
MNRVRKGIFLIGVLLFSATGFAQSLNSNSSSPDEQEEAAKYEQYYEIVLERALKNYYKAGTFLVDIKASVERVMVAKGYDVVESPPDLELENLPGLPFIPPKLLKTEEGRDSLKISGFDSRYDLKRLNVKVLVDTSYTEEDLEFIEEAAAMITNAELLRGDIVEVSQKVFPKSTRDILREKAKLVEEEPEEEEVVEEVEEEIVSIDPEEAKNEFLGIDWNDQEQLMYIITGLGAFTIALLLFVAFRKPREKEYEPQMSPYPVSPLELEGKEQKAPVEDEVREINSDKQYRFENDKMYITNTCVSNPGIVADLMREWIESDEEEGIVKAVRSIYCVDPKLLEVLENNLKEEYFESIRFGLSNIESIPIKEKAEEVEKFKKEIQGIKSMKKNEDSNNNLFDFLQQLTDQQLLHLIKGESDEMTAILLAQVAGQRSSYVLQKMTDEKRISIIMKMGKINDIPISIYKKVASHFSSKALSVSDMKYVAADGIESILATIDSLPVDEQEGFVKSIAEKDLKLAKKIRKYFVSFEDLPQLSDEILQASLETLQTEDIIPALHKASEAIQQKILGVRPKREQQLILSELGNVREMSTEDIERARKVLLKQIRQYLKTNGS